MRKSTFAAAVKKFFQRNKSKEILDALNEAFSEAEEPEETNPREKSKTQYLKKVLKKESTSSDRHIKK